MQTLYQLMKIIPVRASAEVLTNRCVHQVDLRGTSFP